MRWLRRLFGRREPVVVYGLLSDEGVHLNVWLRREDAEARARAEADDCLGGGEAPEVVLLPVNPPARVAQVCRCCGHTPSQHQTERSEELVLVSRLLPEGSVPLKIPPGGVYEYHDHVQLIRCHLPGCPCAFQSHPSKPELAPVFDGASELFVPGDADVPANPAHRPAPARPAAAVAARHG